MPTFYDGMCYIIEQKQSPHFAYMTVVIERDLDAIDSVSVRLTSDYEYLHQISLSTLLNSGIFQFSVPFGGIYKTEASILETMIKPLKCKSSETYVSDMQCLVKFYFSEDLSPCPFKCSPIQAKGYQYANKSATMENCTELEDEICNGGPTFAMELKQGYLNCPKPCKGTSYKDSVAKLAEPIYAKEGKNRADFVLSMNPIRRIEKEVLVYDTNDMIGAIGGSLGLFLGFSFFDVICKCLDNLIRLSVTKAVAVDNEVQHNLGQL